MPEIRRYQVQQIRIVDVSATCAVDATRIASAAFENGQNSAGGVINGPENIWGNTDSYIRETELLTTETRI